MLSKAIFHPGPISFGVTILPGLLLSGSLQTDVSVFKPPCKVDETAGRV